MFGGDDHEGADCVAAEVAPDFLFDQVRGFGPQHHARAALMRFQLVEHGLDHSHRSEYTVASSSAEASAGSRIVVSNR